MVVWSPLCDFLAPKPVSAPFWNLCSAKEGGSRWSNNWSVLFPSNNRAGGYWSAGGDTKNYPASREGSQGQPWGVLPHSPRNSHVHSVSPEVLDWCTDFLSLYLSLQGPAGVTLSSGISQGRWWLVFGTDGSQMWNTCLRAVPHMFLINQPDFTWIFYGFSELLVKSKAKCSFGPLCGWYSSHPFS